MTEREKWLVSGTIVLVALLLCVPALPVSLILSMHAVRSARCSRCARRASRSKSGI